MSFASFYAQALQWLAIRGYGEQELARKLADNGASPEEIRQVLDRCLTLGYLDDQALAEGMIRSRLRYKQYGPLRIEAELRRKGLTEETIRQTMDEAASEIDLEQLAREALQRRFGANKPLSDEEERISEADARKQWRRQYDFLARKGFPFAIIRVVLNKDFEEG